jgi:hypothetical protein
MESITISGVTLPGTPAEVGVIEGTEVVVCA